jgi:hypothetical protein
VQCKKRVRGQLVPARAMSIAETTKHLGAIVNLTETLWDWEQFPDGPIFVLDNPGFHNVPKKDLEKMGTKGGLVEGQNLLRPPKYSGDFMQAIEHVHGTICSAYRKKRFQAGDKFEIGAACRELSELFGNGKLVSAASVSGDCLRVLQLVHTIVERNSGDFVDMKMT